MEWGGGRRCFDCPVALSDLCFFDFDLRPSSAWSRFRFFSPCEDLCFLSDFDLCFSDPIVAAGLSIDIFENRRYELVLGFKVVDIFLRLKAENTLAAASVHEPL